MEWKRGKTNKVADALSRIYEESECIPEEAFCELNEISLFDLPGQLRNEVPPWNRPPTLRFTKMKNSVVPGRNGLLYYQENEEFGWGKTTYEELINLERGDPSYEMRAWIDTPPWTKRFQRDYEDVSQLPNYRPETDHGIIGIEIEGRFKPWIPKYRAAELIMAYHERPWYAHMGPKRTCARSLEHYALPGIRKIAKDILDSCETCLRRKRVKPRQGFLKSKPPKEMWEQVAMDFSGPYPKIW